MLNPILAHTSSGVETVSQLDKDALDKLARWLCEENAYHDTHYYSRQQREHNVEADDRRYDAEYKANGGYCDRCKDFAGELLANFDLTEGREARIKRMTRELGEF